MSPAKPERLRAIEELCVAQQRLSDALMSLAAFEGADLEGALRELSSVQGRVQAARLAVRRAIVERDGEVRFPAGENAQLVTRDDRAAQLVMASEQNARVDAHETASEEVRKWTAA